MINQLFDHLQNTGHFTSVFYTNMCHFLVDIENTMRAVHSCKSWFISIIVSFFTWCIIYQVGKDFIWVSEIN